MAHSQKRPKLTKTGARYIDNRKKRQFELGNEPLLTKIGPTKRLTRRGLGGTYRKIALSTESCNVWDGKRMVGAKITSILENPANPNFVRRGILTKGTIIETDKGRARITSRPSHTGHVQAVLVQKV